ncbi:hypothetical protein QBC34DRAFT_350319 [Podospora aff. communis PSN243]|uniref:DUF6536 domain-containing protein n=1 Tax=Podospora aff. communis PSN243 TaxID=3040156 RepID=A0AAV9GLT0_9PEZI|nr:hypothetical protein QBC34DRAFT_350319 [Podospora aff. communis PSN243]
MRKPKTFEAAQRRLQVVSKLVSEQRILLWSAFGTCFVVFLINLGLYLYASTKLMTDGHEDFVRDLYSGDCDVAERASLASHAIINLLSTLMLWASNLAMQFSTAPDRAAINMAHQKGQWFDIGVLSLHNLKSIPAMNRLVWAVLAISSVPIHFLYNSVIFNTLNANAYRWYTVGEDFFVPPPPPQNTKYWNGYKYNRYDCLEDGPDLFDDRRLEILESASALLQDYVERKEAYQNASLFDCLQRFNNPFVYRPNVLLVGKETRLERELCLKYKGIPTPESTLFSSDVRGLNDSYMPATSETFDPGTLCLTTTEYTFEDRMRNCALIGNGEAQRECRLQCSPTLLLAVTMFNLLKCCCILWVIYRNNRMVLIITLGDAVASFLEEPDPHTWNFGVATKASITKNLVKGRFRAHGRAINWERKKVRWWHAVEPGTWFVAVGFFLGVIGSASFCVAHEVVLQTIYHRDASLSGLWRLGFGDARWEALISWGQAEMGVRGLFENLVVANVWQVLLSLLYTAFNLILASQLVALEWSRFGNTEKPKGLRVSRPVGEQRSTYYLSMPYRYALPTMAFFYLAHFLVSQSSFIIRLVMYDWDGTPLKGRTMAGFSPIPSLLGLIFTALLFIAYIFNSLLRRYPAHPRMPLVSTNSLAISANCHPPEGDKQPHLKKLTWGVIDSESSGGQGKRCSLTSMGTSSPEDEMPIFGLDEKRNTKIRNIDRETRWVARMGIWAGL